MSKCRPTMGNGGKKLLDKGVTLEEIYVKTPNGKIAKKGEEERYVVIKIPYESLKNEPEVQIAFQDLVFISTESDEDGDNKKE